MQHLQERAGYLEACTRCSGCKWVPNIESDEFAQICPSVHYGKFHPYSGGGKMINAYALLKGLINYDDALIDTIYSCSNCGGCDVACKANFGDAYEPLAALYALRQQVVADGQLPEPLKRLLANLRATGNRFGYPPASRGRWCATVDVKRWPDQAADTVLYVGDLAFDEGAWPQLRDVIRRLGAAGVDVAIAGENEVDLGGLAFDIGDGGQARDLAEAFLRQVQGCPPRRLIICDDQAFAAVRNVFPRLGLVMPNVETLHLTEWLSGNFTGAARERQRVTYHDSCRLGRLGEAVQPWRGNWEVHEHYLKVRTPPVHTNFGAGVYDAPRHLLTAVNAEIVEMPRNRESAFCCGNGGGAKEFNPDFARSAGRERLREACSTGAELLISSCGGCVGHLKQIAEEDGLGIGVISLMDYLRQRSGEQQ
ncbi:(Fe-S)-binding protein [Nitrospirillum iridis]|uniref:Fe-S oxidoreductase n=1 Tax=Nitrospirillum iridis TaxID=765888 RepID=A0A7X0B0U3_9PROT|nr:(Fe-S)-binding protein [Nitrospirillum iridis]MBB6253277.1 Fe-S oxidoreductase [Nitrospirillum iridis]